MANLNDTYASVLSGYSGSVNDRRSELLTGILAYAKPLSLNDMEAAALASLGYNGALNDAWDKYIKALGGFGFSAKADYLSSTFYGNPVPFLFKASEPGAWYDPSDLTTMFQDNLGTTPVTAAGQTVGLLLDKSKNGVGTNGSFCRNLLTYSSWSDAVAGTPGTAPTGWSFFFGTGSTSLSGGLDAEGAQAIKFDATVGQRIIYNQSANVVAGNTYSLSADVVAISGTGGVVISITSGTATGTSTNVVSPSLGRATARYVCTTSGTVGLRLGLGITVGVTATASITLKKPQFEIGTVATAYQPITSSWSATLAGNHATQATSTQRPIYGVNPVIGTRNLLTYSSWSDAVAGSPGTAPTGWTIGFGTGAQTSLVGSLDVNGAQAIQFDADSGERIFYTQTVNVVAGSTYILSTEILAVSGLGNTVVAIVSGTATGTAVNVVNPTSTGRVTATYVCTVSGSVTLRFGLGVTSAAGTSSITFKKPQFEVGSKVTNYQKVVSQYEVTEVGVQSIGYLAFDGVDDGMVTGTITPGTDKVQVFAGVRKLSDAAQKIVAEMSATIASNDGAFALTAPNSAAANYNFSSKGTTQTDNVVTTYTAPITSVISGLGDIAGASNLIRVNGTQVGSTLTTQGTGNYLAYPLYIGRRGGSTLPYNGRLYSLIVRFGSNLTTGQTTSTEKWVNSKTGAY